MTGVAYRAGHKTKKARIEEQPHCRQEPQKATPSKDKEKTKDTSNVTSEWVEHPSPLPSSFNIIAGSYEKLLYGLNCSVSRSELGYEFHLEPAFMFPAHVSSIKAVAASPSGKWLATGSVDEIVKVWDLVRRKEVGGLMHHQGRSPLYDYAKWTYVF